jgi:hypothetical protein
VSNPQPFEAWAVRVEKSGKLCHYADGRIVLGGEFEAITLAERKAEDGIPATPVRVRVTVERSDVGGE